MNLAELIPWIQNGMGILLVIGLGLLVIQERRALARDRKKYEQRLARYQRREDRDHDA